MSFGQSRSPNATRYECEGYLEHETVFRLMFGNSIDAILMCIVGFYIRGWITQKPKVDTQGSGQIKDLPRIFGCGDQGDTCIVGWLCPIVRASDTYHALEVADYVRSLLCLGALFALPSVFGYIAVSIAYIKGRAMIREKTGLAKDLYRDLLCICCCQSCAICQEARHIESMRSGARVMNIIPTGDTGKISMVKSPVVGQPFTTNQVVGQPIGLQSEPNDCKPGAVTVKAYC